MINTIVLKSTCTVTFLDRHVKAELGKVEVVNSVDQDFQQFTRVFVNAI